MEDIHAYLKELAFLYQSSMKQLRNIEDKAAISILTRQFTNNMRNFIEHTFVAIEKAYLNPQDQRETIKNFEQALHDIRNIALDHSQYIAGMKLGEAKKHIMRGISLSERKNAQEYFKKAVYHYTEGRDKRTGNPQEAIEHFTKTVELCTEGMLAVKPVTLYQWIMFVVALSGWVTFLAKIFGLF